MDAPEMRQICFTAGVIFEYYDENLENPWSYSIKDFVNDWSSGAIYGWKSETPKAATG
jgi:hypothetical protein